MIDLENEEKNHFYLEEDRLVVETNSKFYKRLIVGMIKYYSENNQNIKIPEEYFKDIPDNIGFKSDSYLSSDPLGNHDDIREFSITDQWLTGIDDEGGFEKNIDELVFKLIPKNKEKLKLLEY